MTAIYGYLRERLTPATDYTIATATGGNLTTSGTLYFAVQAYSQAGRNLPPATLTTISYSAGQKITVTINASARATGEDVFGWIISASVTNDPAGLKQLAVISAKDPLVVDINTYPEWGADKALPLTLDLTEDAHLTLSGLVANTASLPTGANLVHGMLRDAGGIIYRYDQTATATTGNIPASTGYWLIHRVQSFSTYLANLDDRYGCDRPIPLISADDLIPPPSYKADGSNSTAVAVNLLNGRSASGTILKAGAKLDLQVLLSGRADRAVVLSGLILVRFLGIINTATNVLDIAPLGVGTSYPFYAGSDQYLFTLPRDIQPNEAIAVEVYLSFKKSELTGNLFEEDSLSVLLYDKGKYGYPSSLWRITGNTVLPQDDRCRIYPALSGKVTRASGALVVERYESDPLEAEEYSGLATDSANQVMAISSVQNGKVIARALASDLLNTEAIRAFVSTEPGNSAPSPASATATLTAGQVLTVTIPHACDANGVGTIRVDYPDTKIAGRAIGKHNPPQLRLYITYGGTIYDMGLFSVLHQASQDVTVTDLAAGTTIVSVPSATSSDFCLYSASQPTIAGTSGSSVLVAGDYTAQWAYEFPSPNALVTKISHDTALGCIPEMEADLATGFNRTNYWAEGLADLDALRAIPLSEISSYQSRYIYDRGNPYRYNPFSMEVDDGTAESRYVKPTEKAIGDPGRWEIDDSNEILFFSDTPDSNAGEVGDVGIVNNPASSLLGNLYQKTDSATWTLQGNLNGISAFTFTTADFTQPAEGANVTIPVQVSSSFADGLNIFVEGGGYYQVASKPDVNSVIATNLANHNNPVAGTIVPSDARISSAGTRGIQGEQGIQGIQGVQGVQGVQGEQGIQGIQGIPGSNAYTTTTASFTQPAISANVTIAVADSTAFVIGQNVAISSGGTYSAINKATATSLEVQNLGYAENATPGTVVASGVLISPTGKKGDQGVPGALTGASILELTHSTEPTTVDAGETWIYSKADGKVYRKIAGGTETEVGGLGSIPALELEQQATAPTATTNRIKLFNLTDSLRWVLATGTELIATATNRLNIFTRAQVCTPVNLSIASGVVNIDCSLSNSFVLILTANVTSITASNVIAGTTFDLEIKQDATGNRTLNGWSTAFIFSGGAKITSTATTFKPSTANQKTILSFKSFDGTSLFVAGTGEVYS